jgi:hypothetical protein
MFYINKITLYINASFANKLFRCEAAMKNLHRVQKTSRFLRGACTVAIPIIPVGLAAIWATLDWWLVGGGEVTGFRPWEGAHVNVPQPIPTYSLALGFLSSMLPAGLMVYALWQLRALFGLYGRGQIFTAENAQRLRRFALAVLAMTLASPLENTLTILAVTLGNPPGQRLLSVGFSSSELVTLFMGAIFLVIAWVMDEARELAEDQAQII